jgi:hypothetical protein
VNKNNRIAIYAGLTTFFIVVFMNIIVVKSDAFYSIGKGIIFGFIIIIMIQSINNYFFKKIKLEGYSLFYAIVKIVIAFAILIFVFN